MRADRYLVDHGHYPSRARAQAAIKAGCVRCNGQLIRKASETIPEGAEISARADHPWVGRGGLKLDYALTQSGFDVSGHVGLDIGSSTGGFTDVLLARGAVQVFAVDVGHDQLHPRLRADDRVVVMEGQDARTLTPQFISTPDIVVCDASFIPLSQVLPVPLSLARRGAQAVILVKPQFEVGRGKVGRGGIVRDRALQERAVGDASTFLTGEGWEVEGFCESPITGGSGNREALIWAVKTA